MIKVTKKMLISTGVFMFSTLSFAQTLDEGIELVDSHKYAKAKEVFSQMIQKSPNDAENYFYLGNAYLTQFEPNFEKATEYFNKGLAINSKSYLNKVGLASIKMLKDDRSGIQDLQQIVNDTKSKDDEVLYRVSEALTLNEKNNAPDMVIDFLNKAIKRSKKGAIPAHYYYALGDAYRLKKDPGSAMTQYENALDIAKNKSSVYTRMATLWMAAQQWKLAKENLDKAIATDATYAPEYKALAGYNFRLQENLKVTQNLLDYSKYADEDPYTQFEIAKLYFLNDNHDSAKAVLDKVFDKVDDPVKYKLRAYNDFASVANYAEAQKDLNIFMTTVKDKTRIQPADKGLEGLLKIALAKDEKDEVKKNQIFVEALKDIEVAKLAKDQTLDWDAELAKLKGGGASQLAADSGPQSPKIQELKAKLKANPKDAKVIVDLGTEYQEVQNWNGAALTWDKMIALTPDWIYAYFAKGTAYQQLGNHELAETSYQKYIDMYLKSTPEVQMQNKEAASYAYYLVAFYNQEKNLVKAKEYVAKAVEINPIYEDAKKLNDLLSKK